MFNTSDIARGYVRPAKGGWRVFALAFGILLPGIGSSARLGLNPVMGDGAAGRTVVLSGSGFLPGAVLNVTVNAVATSPATVTASATGFIAPVTLTLPALPYGGNTVVLSNAVRTYTFTGAFRVFANLCLAPAMGDGRPGQTWRMNAQIPVGGWSGQVFIINGTGFAAGATLFANSVTVGGATAYNDQVIAGPDGRLPSSTVVVPTAMARGPKDVYVPVGISATTFYGVYEVRRTIGLFPARGPDAGGATATVFIEGFGYDNGTIAANLITLGGAGTLHGAVTITNGAWFTTVRLTGAPGTRVVTTGQETFQNSYVGTKATDQKMGMSPTVLSGVPNQAVQVEGMGNLIGPFAANSSLILGPAADQTMTHAQVTAATVTANNGRFPRMWMKIDGSQSDPANGIRLVDNITKIDTKCVDVKQSFSICPVLSTGAPGWTITLTGYALGRAVALLSVTVNGRQAQVLGAPVTSQFGETAPFGLMLPVLPLGAFSATALDATPASYVLPLLTTTRQTIGLSAVNGPGGAGDTTDILGTGFPASGSIGVNTITWTGTFTAATTHAAIPISLSGTFSGRTITLPALTSGPYDLAAQGVFPAAYRVTPMIGLSKHRTPVGGGPGDVVTFAFSFTNIGVGDAAGGPFTLVDTVPPGLVYVAGSGASKVPGTTIDWRSWTCSCYVGAEPAPADVAGVRWRLPGALPRGASGVVSFQAVVP